ncbi:hypothetical protein AB0I28_38790 [Phytomonospora sp. NPDC050363]|uniref:hypothetical protein n=1 Tax=Phytomonospora sp. NPDC050363 TaxID=3155642 RepID=UPI00340076D5
MSETTIKVDSALRDRLKAAAEREGVGMGTLIARLLDEAPEGADPVEWLVEAARRRRAQESVATALASAGIPVPSPTEQAVYRAHAAELRARMTPGLIDEARRMWAGFADGSA